MTINNLDKVILTDILVLPAIPLIERQLLPNIAAIYFVVSQGELFYIGATPNLFKRWRSHTLKYLTDKRLFPRFADAKIHFWACRSKNRIFDLEAKLIGIFKPRFNAKIPYGYLSREAK